MWLWHEPSLCSAATSNSAVRVLQVVSLLCMGTLFWWPILGPNTSRRLSTLAGVVYLFTACLGCTVLGIIITFSPVSVCPVFMQPHHNHRLMSLIQDQWGITPALDQQIGGLMMWVPACGIYVVSIVALLTRWYYGSEPQLAESNAAQPSPTKT